MPQVRSSIMAMVRYSEIEMKIHSLEYVCHRIVALELVATSISPDIIEGNHLFDSQIARGFHNLLGITYSLALSVLPNCGFDNLENKENARERPKGLLLLQLCYLDYLVLILDKIFPYENVISNYSQASRREGLAYSKNVRLMPSQARPCANLSMSRQRTTPANASNPMRQTLADVAWYRRCTACS